MRRFVTLLLTGTLCLSSLSIAPVLAQDDPASSGKQSNAAADLPDGCIPSPGGGYWYESGGCNCPCDFDTYWDVTGGRSPADWAGACGYGYECHTWNARAEYLVWFSRGRKTPVLVETFAGIQGDDVTQVRPIYGNEPIGENARSGLRLTLGRLLADGQTTVEGRFWGLEDSTERFGAVSSRTPRFGRPIFDVTRGEEVTVVFAAPGEARGTIDILSKNDMLGADAWLRRTVWNDGYCRFDLLAGYQFARFDDSIAIRSSSIALPGNTRNQPVGVLFEFEDSFRTQNEFHGVSLGFATEHRRKYWSIELLGKVGLGSMREAVVIDGQSSASFGGATARSPRGLLTQPSNIGSYERHRFAVVPELNVNGVLNLSPSWRLLGGYSIIYWSDAVLAGDQIDTRVNATQFPGPVVGSRLPVFAFNANDYVVQGLNLGAEYRW
jgi:hypothetical protein